MNINEYITGKPELNHRDLMKVFGMEEGAFLGFAISLRSIESQYQSSAISTISKETPLLEARVPHVIRELQRKGVLRRYRCSDRGYFVWKLNREKIVSYFAEAAELVNG